MCLGSAYVYIDIPYEAILLESFLILILTVRMSLKKQPTQS